VRRFTITPERIAAGRVAFDRGESRHLSRVLRLRSGDTVLAADGTGREYTVRLETVGEQATGTVLGVAAGASESPVQITLVQSCAQGRQDGGESCGRPPSSGSRTSSRC
jgi:16S rRNA (uracil1498-N3)-methyltransferase